jgi:hypothetical protein
MEHLSDVHLVFQKSYIKVSAPTPTNPMGTKDFLDLSIKIKKCRPRLSLDGTTLPITLLDEDPATGKMRSIGGSFKELMAKVFPHVPAEKWDR